MRNACLLLLIIVSLIGCVQNTGDHSPAPVTPSNEIDFWLTKNDETVKLEKQAGSLSFDTSLNQHPSIEVDESITYQSVDGFGFTLTGGSAQTIKSLDESTRQQLLHELFGSGANSISVSYLRLSMGASDLSTAPFTYDDLPIGKADPGLSRFSLADDTIHLIPLLREILQINPAIKIIATPWSPPTWMKDNNSFIGGSLKATNYAVYAQYFVKYIQQMKAMGITIDAITPQNEPLNPGNNPSMLMPAAQQAIFIKDHLGPAFHAANLATKIIIYDHNCDKPEYPLSILNDPKAKHFINGSAFHLYGGDISVLSTVRKAHPDKALYFTEQYTASNGNFGGDLQWHFKNVIIGSMRNWSRTALEWNLASDSVFNPHTPGGCDNCKGGITITSKNSFQRNVAYYIIAHASKFVSPGSLRISSIIPGNLNNVAFKTPAGKKVLLVANDGESSSTFNIRYNGKSAVVSMAAGSIASFIW